MAKLGIKIPKGIFEKGREALKNGDGFENSELEPGRYNAYIKKASAQETKNGPMIFFELWVPEANDGQGGRVSIGNGLSEERIVFLMRDLKVLGYDVDEIDDGTIAEVLEDLETNKPGVKLSAKKKGEYVNLRIEKLLTEEENDEMVRNDKDSSKKSKKKAEDEDEEEEEEKPKKKKKPAAEEEDDEDDEDEKPKKKSKADEDDEEEEEEEDEKPKKKAKDEDEDEDEDEEEEKPKKKAAKEDDEDEDEEDEKEEEEETEIEVGLKCKATIGGKLVPVEVVKVYEDEGKVNLKLKDGSIEKKIPVSKLSA